MKLRSQTLVPRQRSRANTRRPPSLRRWMAATVLAGLHVCCWAQSTAAEPPKAAEPPEAPSILDAPLFYQLLVGELEAQAGHTANAFEVMLDAARRTKDDTLFRRSVELAIQGRSADRALSTAQAWRQAKPDSLEATRTQVQLLVVTNQLDKLGPALQSLIQQAPVKERPGLIASLPHYLRDVQDKRQALAAVEQALSPFVNAQDTRTAARVALGRMNLAAGQTTEALALARRAHADDRTAPGPALLALELMDSQADAETLVQAFLRPNTAPVAVRMAYARQLEQQQRIVEAVAQLRLALAAEPDNASGWLALAGHLVELRQSKEAIHALERFMALPTAQEDHGETEDDESAQRAQRAQDLARLWMSQAHLQLGDLKAAQQWADQIPNERSDLSTQLHRAGILARQGQLEQGRTLLRAGPASDQPTARSRLLAEAQLLRENKQWQAAYDMLLAAMRETPDDSTLIYELAMVAERLQRYDDMEALLRRVISLKPDDAAAFNALGYTLAERGIRLDEAELLLQRAAKLSPQDPFIVDSLGWIAFRLGRMDEAQRLLEQAHSRRPHVEVAAHLGEVMWSKGQREAALRLWREAQSLDADNEVLTETLTRLKVKL